LKKNKPFLAETIGVSVVDVFILFPRTSLLCFLSFFPTQHAKMIEKEIKKMPMITEIQIQRTESSEYIVSVFFFFPSSLNLNVFKSFDYELSKDNVK
jgi:hypothetical protein